MSIQWYYKVGEKEAGPLTELQVRAILFSSEFRSDAAIRQGTSQWFTAESVRRMFSELEAVGWYVFFEDREHGPYIRAKLEEIVSQNHFGPSALVREGVMGNWELLSKRFGNVSETSPQSVAAGPTLINSHFANEPSTAKIGLFTIPSHEPQVPDTKLNEQPHRSVPQEPIARAARVQPPPLLDATRVRPATSPTVPRSVSSTPAKPKVAFDHEPVAPPVAAPPASIAQAPVSGRREPPSIKLAIGIMTAVVVGFIVIYAGSLLFRSTPQTASSSFDAAAQTNRVADQTSSVSSVDRSINKVEPAKVNSDVVVEKPLSTPPLGNTSSLKAPTSLRELHDYPDGPKEFPPEEWTIYKEKLFQDHYLGFRVSRGVYTYKNSPAPYAKIFLAMRQTYKEQGYQNPTPKQIYNGLKILLGGKFNANSDTMIKQISASLKSQGNRFLDEQTFQQLDR